MNSQLPENIDGLPNLSGSESQVESAVPARRARKMIYAFDLQTQACQGRFRRQAGLPAGRVAVERTIFAAGGGSNTADGRGRRKEQTKEK